MSGTLMATCVLCRRVPRLRNLPGLRTAFSQARHTRVKPEDETDDREKKEGELRRQEASFQGGYRLHYNPSSYHHHSVQNSAISSDHTGEAAKELRVSAQAPAFMQRSNRCNVSCVRHISISKNVLLDLAFNKGPQDKTPSASSHPRPVPVPKVDSRAFLKHRPEYASCSHDLTQRPDPIEWEEAMLLLQEVTVLKSSMKPSDVLKFLLELSRVHPNQMSLLRSDQRFAMLLQHSVEHLRLFTQVQLLEVLQSFVWLDMPSDHAVLELYEAELKCRAKQMSLHELIFTADLWRCIGKKVPQFLQHLYDSVHLNLEQVRVPELVHLLYIIGEDRHFPEDLSHPLQQLLMRHLQQLLPEEVGAVCLGLFKSQKSVSVFVATRIVDKGLSFVQEMSDLSVVNVFKFLRFNYLLHRPWLEAMEQEVSRRAHGMGVKGLMHVALTCSALRYRNDSIFISITERLPSLLPYCRSKDASKLLWACGSLGVLPTKSPNFYLSLTETLRRVKTEFQQYPEHLLSALLGLAFVSHFPEDLIEFALSPDFVKLALNYRKLDLKKDLFTLDGTVALELPQWTGPRLSCELREEVAERMWKFAQSNMCLKPEVQETESALQDLLGGEQFVCKRMILPHTRSIDLEVHLDSAGQPIPLNLAPPKRTVNIGVPITDGLLTQLRNIKDTTGPSSRVKPTSFHRLQPDEDMRLFNTMQDLKGDITEGSAHQDSKDPVKLAVQIPLRNQYCIQSQELMGLHAMKRRQLKNAGYRVVDLNYQEWVPMIRKSRYMKHSYLHCKLYEGLP